MKASFLIVLFGCVPAFSQVIPGVPSTAAQQAIQQMQTNSAQVAAIQAQFAAQQAQLNASRLAGEAAFQRMNPSIMLSFRPMIGNTAKPVFSVESKKIEAGTEVRLRSETHYSTIYYTTDGWTPTTASTRYTGPIVIKESTYLQAIAVGPNLVRSPVSHIEYTVKQGGNASAVQPVEVTDGVLHAGTQLRLVTGQAINSSGAQVGDKLSLLLDQDVMSKGTVIAAKGTPVNAILTMADPMGNGAPGDLVFEVHSLDVKGISIALSGGETLEGADSKISAKEAEIAPGMVVIASVVTDTPIKP
jgi:hypothetical protein